MTLHMWVSKETGWYNSGKEDNEALFRVHLTDTDDTLASNDISPAQVSNFLGCDPEMFLRKAAKNHVIHPDCVEELLNRYDVFVVNGQTFEKKVVTSVQFVPTEG